MPLSTAMAGLGKMIDLFKSVTGSHPAVIGIDFDSFSCRLAEAIQEAKDKHRKNVADTYNRGGVNTVA